jgi:hypothetical protein
MQYWWLTDDTTYNDIVMTAMMYELLERALIGTGLRWVRMTIICL